MVSFTWNELAMNLDKIVLTFMQIKKTTNWGQLKRKRGTFSFYREWKFCKLTVRPSCALAEQLQLWVEQFVTSSTFIITSWMHFVIVKNKGAFPRLAISILSDARKEYVAKYQRLKKVSLDLGMNVIQCIFDFNALQCIRHLT